MATKTPLFDDKQEEAQKSVEATGNHSDPLSERTIQSLAKRGTGEIQDHLNAIRDAESNVPAIPKAPAGEADIKVNLSPKKPGPAGIVGAVKNLRGAKDKGPTALISAIIAVGISVAAFFGSTSLLGQAINGNALQMINNGLSMMGAANGNIASVRIFGKSKCTKNYAVCSFEGITQDQIDDLKARGVKLRPEGGIPIKNGSNTFIFSEIEIDGEVFKYDDMEEALKKPHVAKLLNPVVKPASFVSEVNFKRLGVRRLLGINLNPDTNVKDKKALAKAVYENVRAGDADIGTRPLDANDIPDPDSDPNSSPRISNSDIDLGSTNLAEQAEALERRATDGELLDAELPTGDILTAVGREGQSLEDASNLYKKGWAWLNTIDVLDTACTAYQLAHTAGAIARTVSIANTIRYGYMFMSTWDKVKAGDATSGDITELMNVVTAKNKYGESFDQSVGMQYLFTGKISTATPPTVSTVGGQTLTEMAGAMSQLDRFFDIAGGQKSALGGYFIIKNSCALATNLGFQIGVTILDWAVTLATTPFTGGATLAANIGGKSAIKIVFKAGKETLIKTLKEDFVALFTKKFSKETQQIARKKALRTIKDQAKDPLNAVMVGLTLVETFGMDYIVQSLAGTDVLAYLNDSVQTGDAIVAARAAEDTASTIAEGGSFLTIPQKVSYDKENQKAIADDIALKKETANPLDINDPYSTVGSFAQTFAVQLGGINTSSFLSTMGKALQVPLTSLSKLTAPTYAAGDEATAQNLSDFINNPVLKELNLSNDIMGNPGTGVKDLEYLKKSDPTELLSRAVDQGDIFQDGRVMPNGGYAKHVDDCNNPARVQVDPTLFDDDLLQPEYCREDTAQNSYYNALTTYRSLLVDESSLTGSGDGTKAEIAQRLIDKGNVTFWPGNGGVHPTLEEIASGKNNGNDSPCGINIYVLKILDAVSDKYPVTINDLNRHCEENLPGGVVWPDGKVNYGSKHYAGNGSAIDFGFVGGVKLTGRNPRSLEVLKMITPLLQEASAAGGGLSGVGQSTCGGGFSPPSGIGVFSDGCNHLHVDVPRKADPDLLP